MFDRVRCISWDSVIGQEWAVNQIRSYAEHAVKTSRAMPPILLAGPPGTGKTTMATLTTSITGDNLEVVMGNSLTSDRLASVLLSCPGATTVLIDEAHGMSRSLQRDMLSLLEQGVLHTRNRKVRISDVTSFILATTDLADLSKPLQDRCRIVRFESYSDADMTKIGVSMAARIGVDIDPTEVAILAPACNGTPRHMRHFIEVAEMLAGGDRVTAHNILSHLDIDDDGCTREHRSILRALDELGGTAGLDRLAGYAGMLPEIVEEAERLLVRRGLIEYDARGRRLTGPGYKKTRGVHVRPASVS